MADALGKWHEEYVAEATKQGVEPTTYGALAYGVTKAAVSMRARAVQKAQTEKSKNDVINAIGSLSDIPAE